MGTPDFAKDSLEALVNAKYNVEAVVTNPDRPKGRGMKMMMSPVKEFALSSGIEKIYQPEKVKNNEISVSDINESLFQQHLVTQDEPPVDLLIRTSGEQRISNFLLWQIAYAELCFLDVLWPDFSEKDFNQAIACYQQRHRRFGGTE